MRASRTPVITGIGAQTCVGAGVDRLWGALINGESGLRIDPELQEFGARCHVSGRLRDIEEQFTELSELDEREKRHFGRFGKAGLLAAFEALEDADAEVGFRDSTGGVLVGSGIGPMSELADAFRRSFEGRRFASPGHAVFRTMPSFLPSFLANRMGASLGGATMSLGCTSALYALDQACRAIRSGAADWYLVGAVEIDSPHTWLAFDAQRLLAGSPRPCETPEAESRPFDARAHGFIPSGGAAFMMVESTEHATARAAGVRAVIRASAHRMACHSTGSPMKVDEEAYRGVVRLALQEAGLEAGELDFISPHALSSPLDGRELSILDREVDLAAHQTPVNTPRALLGYSIAASGLIDLIHVVLQLEHDHLVGNVNFESSSDEASSLESCITFDSGPRPLRYALKSSYAFAHANAAVLLEEPRASSS